MDLERRFLFHANASAYGGRIVRPKHVVVLSEASCATSVSGGRAETSAAGRQFKPFFRVGAASAVTEAGFVDREAAKQLTLGKGQEDALASASSAKAVVEKIEFGKRLVVRHLAAGLQGMGRPREDEPAVIISGITSARGVEIDGCTLIVEFDVAGLSGLPTYSAFVKAGAPGCLHSAKPIPGAPSRPILTTIVKSVRWKNKVPPTAAIEGHTVRIKEFGRVFFGEMLVEADARRLTLMRLRLGSPEGGMVDFADVQTNGSWYPPIL